MGEAKHTPKVCLNGYNLTQVIAVSDGPDENGKSYTDGRHQKVIAVFGSGSEEVRLDMANSSFAVRAWNCHYELVDAIEKAEQQLDYGQTNKAHEILVAALSKARGIEPIPNELPPIHNGEQP